MQKQVGPIPIYGRRPELPIDKEAFDWLQSHGVPLQIVVTKADKLKMNERQKQLKTIEERYPTGYPPILYSSLKHTGRDRLLARINAVLLGEEE